MHPDQQRPACAAELWGGVDRPWRGDGGIVRSETGFVLVFLAIAVPAILGLIGLALDGVRLMSMDAELASAADAAALAAASNLDRSANAIPKARDAALALLNTASPDFAGPSRVRLSFRFAAHLSDLRSSTTYTLADQAGADADFVEVSTAQTSLTTSFLQLVGARAQPVHREAIAQSRYFACDVTPAMLCHPDPRGFAARARPGQQYLLRMDGDVATGSVVLLDRPDAESARQVLLNLADDAPQFCYADGLRMRRNVSPDEFDSAVNSRFDRYVSRAGPVSPEIAVFPPAPNIVQGYHHATCNDIAGSGDIDPPYTLPRDTAYGGLRLSGLWNQGIGDWKTAPPVGGTGGRFGTALDEYFAWNHANKGPDFLDQLRNEPTRYDLYLAELGLTRATAATPVDTRGLGPSVTTMPTGGPSTGSLNVRRESPIPVCYAGDRAPVHARRRILYLTIANCSAFEDVAHAESLSRYVGKFFLTEASNTGAMLAEFVGLVEPFDDDGKLRHVVVLVQAN